MFNTTNIRYLVERHPVFAPIIQTALLNVENVVLATSPLVRLEVLVKPMREANHPLQERYEHFTPCYKFCNLLILLAW